MFVFISIIEIEHIEMSTTCPHLYERIKTLIGILRFLDTVYWQFYGQTNSNLFFIHTNLSTYSGAYDILSLAIYLLLFLLLMFIHLMLISIRSLFIVELESYQFNFVSFYHINQQWDVSKIDLVVWSDNKLLLAVL